MSFYEDILVEDWQGLESETERLLLTYGYPVSNSAEKLTENETATSGEDLPGQANLHQLIEGQ